MKGHMEKVEQIIQRNTEIVKRIKEHLDVVNIQFLSAHMYVEGHRDWNRQDPPIEFYSNRIRFDSYAENILTIHKIIPYIYSPHILNTDLEDYYITRCLHCGDDKDTDKAKKMAIDSYNRNEHIYQLIGHHCIRSVWSNELSSDERKDAQESLIFDLISILNYKIDSLREFEIQIGNLTFFCEIVKLFEINIKKVKDAFGERVLYYESKTNITQDNKIDIPFSIDWMTIHWDVSDISDGFFDNCTEAEIVIIPDDLKSFNWSFWNCHKLKEIKTKKRKDNAYEIRKCFSFDGVLFRYLGDGMAEECELIAYPNMHAKSYIIPNKIKQDYIDRKVVGISKFAFKDCDNIEILKIPESVKYIGFNAFYRCNNLRTIYYFGYLKDLQVEGFLGDYGSVNPTWLCKTVIPELSPKVTINYSGTYSSKGKILRFTIGCVFFDMIDIIGSGFFHSKTDVTRGLWKVVMGDYPKEQYNDNSAVIVSNEERCKFIDALNGLTKMRFDPPIGKGEKSFSLYLSCKNESWRNNDYFEDDKKQL